MQLCSGRCLIRVVTYVVITFRAQSIAMGFFLSALLWVFLALVLIDAGRQAPIGLMSRMSSVCRHSQCIAMGFSCVN